MELGSSWKAQMITCAILASALLSGLPPQAKAKNAYELFNERLAKATSISGKMILTGTNVRTSNRTEFAFSKPNLFVVRDFVGEEPFSVRVGNGKVDRDYSYRDHTFLESEVFGPEDGIRVQIAGLNAFITSNPDQPYEALGPPTTVRFSGRQATAINLIPRRKESRGKPPVTTLYFDATSGDLMGFLKTNAATGITWSGRYENLKLNPVIPKETFEWQVPPFAIPAQAQNVYEALLKPGAGAPLFSGKTTSGSAFSLANAVKENRLTVLDFWTWRCGPCVKELPELQKLQSKLGSKGLQIVSVHMGTLPASVKKAVIDNEKISLTMVAGAAGDSAGKQYNILATPTTYIIGPDGKILEAFIGSDIKRLTESLEKHGIK